MTIDISPQAAALDRTAALLANDPQIQRAAPKPDVVTAARAPGLRLSEVLATFVDAYGDRPAIGSRDDVGLGCGALDLRVLREECGGPVECHGLGGYVDRHRYLASDGAPAR